MKRIVLLIMVCFLITSIFAYEDMQTEYAHSIQQRINRLVIDSSITDGMTVNYSFALDTRNLPDFAEIMAEETLPALVKTFAIPAGKANLYISNMSRDVYTLDGTYLYTNDIVDHDKIYLKNDFIFKEMRGFSVFIDLFSIENNEVSVITSADFNVIGSGHYDIPEEVSEAFMSSYRSLANNLDSSYLVNLQFKKPSMIIVSHGILHMENNEHPELANYIRWKKSIGFDVHVVLKGNATTAEQIRQNVLSTYNSLDVKPDYLLLIGGSRSSSFFHIPTFYQTSPSSSTEATDLRYGLMEGDDYFPEMLVGRISVDSDNGLTSVLWKTRWFEMGNLDNSNGWMTRGITVAANFAAQELQPTTPRLMSMWIRDKMLSNGYTEVDSLYWVRDVTEVPTQAVVNAINRGGQIITYRGWGNQTGWHFPIFYTTNLTGTSNAGKLPYVYSIVCGTGDYDNNNTNPTFGEAWMQMGASNQPNGAVAYVGPTYLHTKTSENNSIGSGFISGIFDDGIRIFGATVMRGKIELYNNFPREIEMTGGSVHFYWATYNMLCDPSLNMWIRVPGNMNVSLPQSVSAHENAIVINAPGVRRGYATASRNNNDYTYARIVDGQAILPLPNTDTGANYRVTLYARNYNPIIRSIPIDNSSTGLGLIAYELVDGQFKPTYDATIQLTLKNFSNETIDNAQTTLSSTSEFLIIPNPQANLSPINAGATSLLYYTVSLTDDCPDDLDIPMNLYISPSNHNAKFSMISGGYRFEVLSAIPDNAVQNIGPGESGDVILTIANPGTIPANNITGIVYAQVDAVELTQSEINIGTIEPNSQTTANFSISVAPDCFVGRNARFYIDFYKNDVYISRSYFNLVLGVVDIDAPTGPDRYGYYAYDINDIAYSDEYGDLAPVYHWVEINPEHGGQGSILSLGDDDTKTIDLPFEFIYYGRRYDSLSICDNGWVSFGYTYMTDFRNWNIPSVLGPYAQVAVFWDDLKGQIIPNTNPIEYKDMEIKYWHDEANNRFIVTWDDVYFSSDTTQEYGNIEFQLILLPREDADGELIFQYKTIMNVSHNSNYSTTGIENPTQTDGVCYSFSNYYQDSASPISNGMAIRFTTRAPDPYVSIIDETIPNRPITLMQNYPNPFNPETTIRWQVAGGKWQESERRVSIDIYNIKGQKVRSLVDSHYPAGTHSVTWNGTDDSGKVVGSGIYFYQLKSGDHQSIRRMLLLK